jgi:hypothetical protein
MRTDTCIHCDNWKKKQMEALMNAESIFDAVVDIEKFEDNCIKTCPYVKNSSKIVDK